METSSVTNIVLSPATVSSDCNTLQSKDICEDFVDPSEATKQAIARDIRLLRQLGLIHNGRHIGVDYQK